MILTVGATKGGVGKTATAVGLAIERMLSGRKVWLVDADRQRTAQKAITLRSDFDYLQPLACDNYVDGKTLVAQVRLQMDRYDDIIIDAGGRDSTALRAALGISDALLMPVAPRNFELWAVEDTAELVDEVRSINPELKAWAFLNMAEPSLQSADNRVAVDIIREYEQFDYLSTKLIARKMFSNASGAGMGVSEMRPKDPKAVREMRALLASVF